METMGTLALIDQDEKVAVMLARENDIMLAFESATGPWAHLVGMVVAEPQKEADGVVVREEACHLREWRQAVDASLKRVPADREDSRHLAAMEEESVHHL